MGSSMSTLGGWTIVLCIAGYYAFKYLDDGRQRGAARAATKKQRLDDRQNPQPRKDNLKAKRQRGESYLKDLTDTDKIAKAASQIPAKVSAAVGKQIPDLSSDDGADNREFARQLANVKQGTSFTGPKKDDKRQKSIRQSRAEEREDASAASSTAGVDADDDQSSAASPEIHTQDVGGVSDMLEPAGAGPSVLRLTSSENIKQKQPKKAKEPEQIETKKQRQNRQKAEAAKLAREEAEKDRKVKMEAQRRLARISEGRAAKDGSGFMASQPTESAWTNNSATTTSASNGTKDGFVPVQPLDTFDAGHQSETPKPSAPSAGKSESWMSSLPSEEEQIQLLQGDDDWNTVPSKKSKARKKETAGESNDESAVSQPQQVVPITNKPVITKTQAAPTNGRPTKTFTQKGSFAALSNNDEEVEEEWDV